MERTGNLIVHRQTVEIECVQQKVITVEQAVENGRVFEAVAEKMQSDEAALGKSPETLNAERVKALRAYAATVVDLCPVEVLAAQQSQLD